jgi:1-deoxy-D-xylulose 5-phosphate reductoisomerase
VAAFLAGRIPFGRIADTIERVLEAHRSEPVRDLETVRSADRWARAHAQEVLG